MARWNPPKGEEVSTKGIPSKSTDINAFIKPPHKFDKRSLKI